MIARQTDRSKPPARACLAGWLAAGLLFCGGLLAEEAPPSEYQVKAACLFNLPKYVEWPGDAAEREKPIVLGICGQDNFAGDLRALVESKLVDGRKIVLKTAVTEEDWRACHILFVSVSEKRRAAEIIGKLKDAPVLTVGEFDSFLQDGGIVNFRLKGSKVRLEINLVAAEKARLKISARLLAIADVIRRKE